MPPKAADKKPASKAPATASKAPEKKDAGKKTAASGDKKKRTKTRKETYSSYIYRGMFCGRTLDVLDQKDISDIGNSSSQAGSP